ncbi:MAG: single-stranded DNA-binding protein [Bacteroidales bacterium]
MSLNKVILIGNVGKDPVIRYFDRGVAKATFPLATSETYTNQNGETVTTTEWHNIVIWRALAEVAEKTVKKGTQLYIVGKIKTRSYVDKEGNNKYITEILADTMFVIDRKQGTSTSSPPPAGNGDLNETRISGSSAPASYSNMNNKISDIIREPEIQNEPSDEEQFMSKSEDDLPF